MYGGIVSGGVGEGNHGTESPSLGGRGGGGGAVPCPLEPQRLRVQKCKTQGRPGLAGGCTRGRAGEGSVGRLQPFPASPGQGGRLALGAVVCSTFSEKLGRVSISPETSSHV